MEGSVSLEWMAGFILAAVVPSLAWLFKMQGTVRVIRSELKSLADTAVTSEGLNAFRSDLEGQVSRNHIEFIEASKMRTNQAETFHQQQAEQWRFITELKDRQSERDRQIVGIERDIKSTLQKACRAQKTVDDHANDCKETTDRIWTDIEKTKERIVALEVRGRG